jgi:hypothetical protein
MQAREEFSPYQNAGNLLLLVAKVNNNTRRELQSDVKESVAVERSLGNRRSKESR